MKTCTRNMRGILVAVSAFLVTMLVMLAIASPAIAEPTPETAASSSSAKRVSIADLSTDRTKLAGETVQFTGEVVGSMINADSGHMWVLVNEEGETVSVYMKDVDTEQLENFGAYGTRGDKVRITGVFHLECMTHDGDVDVHATEVKVLRKGGEVEEDASPESLTFVIAIFVIGIIAGIVYWRLRERLR